MIDNILDFIDLFKLPAKRLINTIVFPSWYTDKTRNTRYDHKKAKVNDTLVNSKGTVYRVLATDLPNKRLIVETPLKDSVIIIW